MQAKNNNKVPLEIGFWIGLYILWVFIFQNRTITITRTLGIEFCYLIFITLNYYITINYFTPRFLNRAKYVSFLLLFCLSTMIAALLRAFASYFISIYLYNLPPPDFTKLYPVSLLNIFIWTSILVAGKMLIDKVKAQRHLELVEKEKIKNELDFLKAQHNPHFLFNSLNALYFQIDKTNTDARETLIKLSEMLRYQLYEGSVDRIPVDKELSYLKSYVELQRMRLNNNYVVEFNISESVKNFDIAPMLIIPLVENSFKHISHFSDKPNEIEITLSYNHPEFICEISNTTEQNKKENAGGIGLKNLERRLELLYPERFEMMVEEKENNFKVLLKINTGEN